MQCPYLADQSEQLVFTHLKSGESNPLHGVLAEAGFRRSHNILYRPDCPACNACVPVRVFASGFAPSRSQRRVLSTNGDAPGAVFEPNATAEQFDLFVRYQTSRHGDGSMAKMGFEDYQSMVEDSPVKTLVIEYRTPDDTLVACALSDTLNNGLSMVYSFFDPKAGRRSLGTFMILDHIRRATALKFDFVYLGYWVAEAPKMAYKTNFRPLETLGQSGWERLEPPSPTD
jgi:arginine-tRNA-protein transferase